MLIPKRFGIFLFQNVSDIIKLALIIFIGYKLKIITSETLTFLPAKLRELVNRLINDEQEIIDFEQLPIKFELPKSNKKKVKIPRWIGTLIPFLRVEKLTKKQVEKILKNVLKSNNDPSDHNDDEKLIKSILQELSDIEKERE